MDDNLNPEMPVDQPADTATETDMAKANAQVETKTYTDGTTVTGTGPLPELSPLQQDAADAEPVDYVEHAAAVVAFEANRGIEWIRTRLGDGRIGDLSRAGEFRAVARGE